MADASVVGIRSQAPATKHHRQTSGAGDEAGGRSATVPTNRVVTNVRVCAPSCKPFAKHLWRACRAQRRR